MSLCSRFLFLSSCLFSLYFTGTALGQDFNGKLEGVYRSDLDGLSRYELNLFQGKLNSEAEKSPLFQIQGGLGFVDGKGDSKDLDYGGGVVKIPSLNDLTLLVNSSDESRRETEYQGKVKVLGWLSANGGYTRNSMLGVKDSAFGGGIATVPLGEVAGEAMKLLLRGGYVNWEGSHSGEVSSILYSDKWSAGINWNREQWRAGIGYIEKNGLAAEGLVINNNIGTSGPIAYMANLTTWADHSLLSNIARESRILGVTSTSFENPILSGSNFSDPYTFSNFNRLQYVQDFGDMFNLRYRGLWLPDSTQAGFAEMVVFPFQVMDRTVDPSKLQHLLYLGPVYDWQDKSVYRDSNKFGLLVGIKAFELVKNLKLNVFYKISGVFQSAESNSQDFLAYLSYDL